MADHKPHNPKSHPKPDFSTADGDSGGSGQTTPPKPPKPPLPGE